MEKCLFALFYSITHKTIVHLASILLLVGVCMVMGGFDRLTKPQQILRNS